MNVKKTKLKSIAISVVRFYVNSVIRKYIIRGKEFIIQEILLKHQIQLNPTKLNKMLM